MQPPAMKVNIPTRIPIKGALKLYFFSGLEADIIPKMRITSTETMMITIPAPRKKIPNPANCPPKLPTSNNFIPVLF